MQGVEGARRSVPKTRTIAVRVTEGGYLALENEVWKGGKAIADWARDQDIGAVSRSPQRRILRASIFTSIDRRETVLTGFWCGRNKAAADTRWVKLGRRLFEVRRGSAGVWRS